MNPYDREDTCQCCAYSESECGCGGYVDQGKVRAWQQGYDAADAEQAEAKAENDRIWAEVVRWKDAAEKAQAGRREARAEVERVTAKWAASDLLLRAEIERLRGNTAALYSRAHKAEAQIAAVRALADKWREKVRKAESAKARVNLSDRPALEVFVTTMSIRIEEIRAALSSPEPVTEEASR